LTASSQHDNNLRTGSRLVSEIGIDFDSISVLPLPRIITPNRSSRTASNAMVPVGAGVGGADIEEGFSSLQQDVRPIALEQGCVSRISSSEDEADISE